jgi:hypothetical protein
VIDWKYIGIVGMISNILRTILRSVRIGGVAFTLAYQIRIIRPGWIRTRTRT